MLTTLNTFEEVFGWIFEQVRLEARRNILDRAHSFGISGTFSRIVSPSFIRNLLRRAYNEFVVPRFGASRMVRNQFDFLSDTVEDYVDRLSVDVSKAARLSNDISSVLVVTDKISSSSSLWARTEGHASEQAVRWEQAREVSRFKVWYNVQDKLVRDSHNHEGVHGQRVRVFEQFTLGSGERGMFPGSVEFSVADRINCRCFVVYE